MVNAPEKFWPEWLTPRVERFRLREDQLFLIVTIVIGLVAGLAAVLFTLAIHAFQLHLFGLGAEDKGQGKSGDEDDDDVDADNGGGGGGGG